MAKMDLEMVFTKEELEHMITDAVLKVIEKDVERHGPIFHAIDTKLIRHHGLTNVRIVK